MPRANSRGRRSCPAIGRILWLQAARAHVCVLQTVMGLRAKGFAVRLVRDAVGARTEESRDAAIHRAERHGAELVTTEMTVFEWLGTAQHPKFKDALRLVK